MNLTEFLRARIAEDEAVARKAANMGYTERGPYAPDWALADDDAGRTWHIRTSKKFGTPGYEEHHCITMDHEGLSDSVDPAAGAHIARHDPARVLAECEAKRRIVQDIIDNDYYPAAMVTDGLSARVLCYLADVYADHPDYRQEWKP